MREVAERAGVAMSSVSRVLSGHPDVSPAMRERVLAAVSELGYEPDLLAQSLRRRETMTIGFAVGDISNPLFAEIVASAETALRASGYSLLLTNSEGDPSLDASHIRLLAQRRVDGMILSVSDEKHPETLEALRRLDVPFVVLDRDIETDGAANVFSDHRTGMRDAVNHLLDLGHRRIAMITGLGLRPPRERSLALEECFAERGLSRTYRLLEGPFSVEHGAKSTVALLDSRDPPTAIVAAGNQLMLGALRVIHERGVALGRDVSFVGCDDVAITGLYEPQIAVVRRDTREIGRAAAGLMLKLLRGGGRPDDVLIPTEFVARPSCGPPSGSLLHGSAKGGRVAT
jgi:LacI family transcriptional regulator